MNLNKGKVWKLSIITIAVGLFIEWTFTLYENMAIWPGIVMDVIIIIAGATLIGLTIWYLLGWIYIAFTEDM